MPTLTILFWHSSWSIIWNYIWHFFLKNTCWNSIWHSFWIFLAYILNFFLALCLAFTSASILAFYLAGSGYSDTCPAWSHAGPWVRRSHSDGWQKEEPSQRCQTSFSIEGAVADGLGYGLRSGGNLGEQRWEHHITISPNSSLVIYHHLPIFCWSKPGH